MGYRIINGVAYPVGNFQSLPINNSKASSNSTSESVSFRDVLNKAIEDKKTFTLSKHAAQRISELNFSNKDMEAIGKGFEIADGKGAKNSVMLYKDIALIASIENKTVITAIDRERAKENIFTNVDSVVIL